MQPRAPAPDTTEGQNLRTALLLAGLAALMALTTWLVAGALAVLLLTLILAVTAILAPRLAPLSVMRLIGAVPLNAWQAPALYDAVAALAERAALAARPRLFFSRDATINALSIGDGGTTAIAFSDGALRYLTPRELAAVAAHEIAHLAAGDLTLMRLADQLARMTRVAALVGLWFALAAALAGQAVPPLAALMLYAAAPWLAALLQLALSRSREFAADLGAVQLTGDAAALAAALTKTERLQNWTLRRVLGAATGVLPPPMLRSHPTTAERVARLRDLDRRT